MDETLAGLPYGHHIADAMSESDINRIVQTFHDAASLMKSVGMDAIEIHFAHLIRNSIFSRRANASVIRLSAQRSPMSEASVP